MSKLKDWKLNALPQDAVCPECKQYRGYDLKQWTLLPEHMYCKYCFIRNVSDKDEQQRIRSTFLGALTGTAVTTTDQTVLSLLRKIIEMLHIMMPQQSALLNDQWCGTTNDDAADHLNKRREIRSAPPKIGRYLIGPELEAKWGDRLGQLIQKAPMSLMRGFSAVLVTPGVMSLHDAVHGPWVAKDMAKFTTDPADYLSYPAAYVQSLVKGM